MIFIEGAGAVVLVALLAVALVYDVRFRRIPNWITFPGMMLGILLGVVTGGGPGLVLSLKGLGTGLALVLVPFLLGGMGAGDVKLMAMVGAFGGPAFAFSAFVWAALMGGVMALMHAVRTGTLKATLLRLLRGLVLAATGGRTRLFLDSLEKEPYSEHIPYGVVIALGAVAAYFKGWW